MSNLKSSSESAAILSGWQPFTFGGVAGLALGPRWRFGLVRFVLALTSTICVVWFCNVVFAEAIRQAIDHLSDTGAIHHGQMEWSGPPVVVLVRGPIVTILIDPALSGEAGQVTDWQVELGRQTMRFRSIFGFSEIPYAPAWSFPLTREALEPWWGAWEPVILAGIAAGSLLFFLVVWGVLGGVYALFLGVYGYFLDRRVTVAVCWRAGQAALFPGALLLDAAIVLYGLKQLDFIGLAFAFGLHLVIAWVYLVVTPLDFPRLQAARARNPFAARE